MSHGKMSQPKLAGDLRRIWICKMFTLLMFAATAVAQETKDLSEASLEELTNIQVYSASKHMQSARDAPSSVTIITAGQIQKYGYRTLGDILRGVRGFNITSDRNYSYVGVRGFERLGDWNSRVLLLIDGHRTNDHIFGQAMIGSEFLVDVDMIERVEVIRGPSSSLYGASAFFAVINVITRKPQLKGWELSIEQASFDTYKGRASYGGNYKGIDLLLSGSFYNSEGQTLFFPEFDNPATNNGITRNVDYESSQHILANVSFRGFTLQGLFSARDKGAPTAYFGAVFNDPRTRSLDYHQYFDLSYVHSIGEKWDLVARASFDQSRLEGPLAFFTGLPDGSVALDKYSDRGNWWLGEVQLSRTLQKHKITFGSELTDNLRQDQGYYAAVGKVFTVNLASSLNSALYAQDEFVITHTVSLSGGLRYDHYANFGGTTNPRLGLIYHPFQPTTFKLLYGSAFRAPEVYENFPTVGPLYANNLLLKPETIQSLEGVIEQGFGQRFKLSGSVFRNRIRDLISLETDAGTGKLVYRNFEEVQITGVEIEFSGHSSKGFEGTTSFTFADANDIRAADQELPNSVRHMAKLNLIAPLIQKRLFGALDAQYTGSRSTLKENTVAGFAVFNVTLLGHMLGRHIDISTSIYNIMDKKYFDPGRPEDVQDAIQQDGRNFRVKLTGRF
jgi:outer membrane receptor for ferrienterochelin and colicins